MKQQTSPWSCSKTLLLIESQEEYFHLAILLTPVDTRSCSNMTRHSKKRWLQQQVQKFGQLPIFCWIKTKSHMRDLNGCSGECLVFTLLVLDENIPPAAGNEPFIFFTVIASYLKAPTIPILGTFSGGVLGECLNNSINFMESFWI